MDTFMQQLNLLKKNQKKFRGIEKGFLFLDSFLDECEIKFNSNDLKEIKNKKIVSIFDYRTSKKYFILSEEIQKYYNIFYNEFLFKNYYEDCTFFVNLRSITLDLMKTFNLEETELIFISNSIVRSFISCFYFLDSNIISKEKLIIDLENKISNFIFSEFNNNTHLALFLIDNFIKNNILIILEKTYLSLADNYFFSHLKFMSFSVAKVVSTDLSDIKYSCNYGFINLTNVISNFILNINRNIYSFLSKELYFEEEKKFIELFYNNYSDLDAYRYELKNFSKENKNFFLILFLEKLIINSYCFHVIITSCFEFYYFDSVPNILYDKTPSLRLNY